MGLFSVSKKESDYFNEKQKSVELVNCPQGGKNCKKHLSVINNNMIESRKYLTDKNYPESIERLKIAFYKTTELQQESCVKCAELFRSTITQSLEQIHEDLQKMSSGRFRGKRYQSRFEFATQVLEEFKKNI